jgi:uncharacterized protein YdhG (YjbR/CyaY superfamily)/energy-coupling factor transporter ATP-binding protein EcfA2
MKERAKELKAEERANQDREAGERDLLAKIAEMPKADRVLAERFHAIVTANAPELMPRTWYGMPAYAQDGKVVCFFQSADKFKSRYATLGFNDTAQPRRRRHVADLLRGDEAHRRRGEEDRRAREEGGALTLSSPADSHDLIRVQGARVNNLKDVSVEIPKRRLTVFTGVSGSGKSSLVFGTIAAESQRLINETYSAFVQGFMPTLARPGGRRLEGLTTGDHRRPGADGLQPPLHVGTATDANAMLRILFSRLGKPHIGSPNAYSFNVPSVKASGAITVERGAGKTKTEKATFNRLGGMCPRCEGMGSVTDFDLSALYDDSLSLNEGALTIPGYSMDGWYGRIFRGCGFFDPDKPIRKYNKKELHDLLYKEPTKIKVDGINLTYEGLIPKIQKSICPRTSTRCSRTSAPSWSGR